MQQNLPVLIVGQGLAGSLLALELISKNIEVEIIDDYSHPNASRVAAGIYHPLIGQKLVKTWLADEAIPFAISKYKEFETLMGKEFLFEMPFYEILESVGDMNDWDVRSEKFELPFIEEDLKIELPALLKNSRAKVLKQNYSGYLDTNVFLDLSAKYFAKLNSIRRETYVHGDLHVHDDHVVYAARKYKCIVFCTGNSITDNPDFAFLPMKASKGETIIVRCDDLKIDGILHQSIFIQPLGDGLFRLGATFIWIWDDETPSQNAVDELMQKFKTITGFDAEFVSASAGIRPSAHDRRPYMGEHPTIKNLFVFSGLGTKGVLLGPLLSKQLADNILNQTPLHPEASVNRLKKYFPTI